MLHYDRIDTSKGIEATNLLKKYILENRGYILKKS